jgi:hypothetical protein
VCSLACLLFPNVCHLIWLNLVFVTQNLALSKILPTCQYAFNNILNNSYFTSQFFYNFSFALSSHLIENHICSIFTLNWRVRIAKLAIHELLGSDNWRKMLYQKIGAKLIIILKVRNILQSGKRFHLSYQRGSRTYPHTLPSDINPCSRLNFLRCLENFLLYLAYSTSFKWSNISMHFIVSK